MSPQKHNSRQKRTKEQPPQKPGDPSFIVSVIAKATSLPASAVGKSIWAASLLFLASGLWGERHLLITVPVIRNFVDEFVKNPLLQVPLPVPDKNRLSIGILPIENDPGQMVASDILEALDKFPSMRVVKIDRKIERGDPNNVRQQVQAMAKKSGFDVIIWGTYTKLDSEKPHITLHWSTPSQPTPSRQGMSLAYARDKDRADFFTSDSWDQISSFVQLVTATNSISTLGFHTKNEQSLAETALSSFIQKTQTLLNDEVVKQKISVDSRAMLSYYLGNALASLSFLQSGAEGSANLHLALEAYRKAREAYPSKNTPWNWEHLKTTLGPQARSQWVDIQDGISSTLDRISNEGSTYDRTITVPEELTALREALKAFPPDGAPLDWGKISASFGRTEGGYEYNFRLYWAAHHLEIGILLLEIQPKGTQSVREAMKAFNVAFAALDWTNPKNTLGLSLQEEIRMKNDWRNYQVEFAQTLLRFRPDGVQEAVKAYREVLASFPKDPPSSWVDLSSDVDATYTMESTKATWRNTTIALAKTLMDEKPEGLQSIRDAVNMYSDVFDAFPKGSPLSWTTTSVDIILSPPPFKAWIQEDMMESWTDTKIALGDALQKLSDHQPGAKGIPSLKKAAQAYKDAMMIYSSYKTPEADLRPRTALLRLQLRHLEGWTDTKIALGVVLQALGERQPGKEGAANLKTSAEEFRAVLRRLSLQKGDDLSDRVTTAQEHLDQTLRLLQQRMNHTTHGKG